VISKLLVLDDVAPAMQNGRSHGVDNARLISTLQGSDEIH
jgi:hypothetical protein